MDSSFRIRASLIEFRAAYTLVDSIWGLSVLFIKHLRKDGGEVFMLVFGAKYIKSTCLNIFCQS